MIFNCCAGPCRYVYQKAYVEFFCSPERFATLQKALAGRKMLTYMAVNAAGTLHSNVDASEVGLLPCVCCM